MKPIKQNERLYKKVVQSILQYIQQNRLQAGDQLPSERLIAQMLNVSRTTVKEALSVLEAHDIVYIRQGVGTFLSATAKQSLQQDLGDLLSKSNLNFLYLIELRQTIESDAAFYAAKRMTASQKQKLVVAYEQLAQAELRREAAVEEDLSFHLLIAEASNNPLIFEMMQLIYDRVKLFLLHNRPETLLNDEEVQQVFFEHEQIVTAILDGQPERAKEAMWVHLESIKERHHMKESKGGL